MKYKSLLALAIVPIILTGCIGQSKEPELTPEELERNALVPVHVRFMLDEFANIGKIPEIDKILATCRKFEISIQIILQNLSQLKKMYKEGWEEFGGNCDTMIYLGGKDQFTNEYISKELGKETIDQQSINQTKGKQGSSSYNNR